MQTPIADDQTFESIDLVKYLVLLWHWAWLIIIVVVIAACGAYFVSKLITPVYQAKTTVLVDMASSNAPNDYSTLLLNSQLTQTYSQMITKSPVLAEVATRLGLVNVDSSAIIAKPVTNTELINIIVESTDPKLAADIANTLVSVFSEQVQSQQTARFSASELNLQSQIADIESKIKAANDQLSNTTDLTEKDRLDTMIANYNQTYSSLVQSYEQVRLTAAQSISSIVQVEPATVPEQPVRPKTLQNVAFAAMVGAILACGMVIVIDIRNDFIKTPEEITEKLKLPVLGVISHYKNKSSIPITVSEPHAPVSEAFRTLRTNVKSVGAGFIKPVRTIMVISAMPGEGKTDVLINLGVVLAQSGQRVLLIDADLRRSKLHSRLGLKNIVGLSNLLFTSGIRKDLIFQRTQITGLSALTAGDSPPNPSEILGSSAMGTILETLKTNYDIILIDTPPCLLVTDAAVMVPYADGVLLVIKPGATHLAPLQRLLQQFSHLNAYLMGAVFNDINLRNSSYFYYYKNSKYYKEYRDSYRSEHASKNGSKSPLQVSNITASKNPLRLMVESIAQIIGNLLSIIIGGR